MKNIFPSIAKNRIENLEKSVTSLGKRNEIKKTFSDWGSIGVWNASDLLTFLLTSRLTMYIADCVEKGDMDGIKQADRYLLYFINYLLLTNIHPPSKPHRDHEPFHPKKAPFPKTYKDAQNEMRSKIANHFAGIIWSKANLKREFEKTLRHRIPSYKVLSDELREKFLKEATPPFLIKNTGLAKELFIFHKLIFKNIGFVVPTLLYQRIFKGLNKVLLGQKGLVAVTVPDFLIVKGGVAMGIEVGRERAFFRTRKAELVTTFSGAVAIPTTQINVRIGNPIIEPSVDAWYDFGFKCNRCYRSFVLCKAFIESESRDKLPFEEMPANNLTCAEICGEEIMRECPDAVADAHITNFASGRPNKKLVHLRCLYNNEISKVSNIVPLFPAIEGLQALEEGLS